MTTLFGEIVHPTSRAIFDDDSSEEEVNAYDAVSREYELKWSKDAALPTSIEVLLLTQGRLVNDFVQHNLLKAEHQKVAEVIEIVTSEHKPSYFRPSKPVSIYRLTTKVYACVCPPVEIEDANSIHCAILPLLQVSKEIMVVTSVPAPLYKCCDPALDLPPSFMRTLRSAAYKGSSLCPVLEQPNIVSSVPAAVLGWCEVFKKAGCLYICFSDSEEVDSVSAEPLVKIFSGLPSDIFDKSEINFHKTAHQPITNLYL